MYCPECGTDAGDANFCVECGADLRALTAGSTCPDCGAEVDDAKFCPECGSDLRGARSREGTRARATGAVKTTASPRRQRTLRPQQAPQRPAHPPVAAPSASRGLSPAVIWGGFGVAAVIVVLIIVFVANGGGPASSASTTTGQAVQAVSADTSGSYGELVQRANSLYDQGSAAFQSQKAEQAAAYFQAAAKVYAAAWKQQRNDPNVGTDYATSLFYSGQVERAIKQVTRVLTASPDFQTGWFNKGNYLVEKARLAGQSGEKSVAKTATAQARVAYQKAIAIDGATQVAKQAQDRLSQLR